LAVALVPMHGRGRPSKDEPSWMSDEAAGDEEKGEAKDEKAKAKKASSKKGREDDDDDKDDDDTRHVKAAAAKVTTTERTALTEASEDYEEAEVIVVHRGPLLTFFVGVSALSVVASLLLAAAHAASLYSYASSRRDAKSRGPVDVALRAYGLVFCAAICFVELEVGATTRSSVVSRFWTLRGLFYAFVGLLAMDNANSDERRRKHHKVPDAWDPGIVPYSIYLKSTAASLLALGGVYVLFGLCWCKRLKDHRTIEYRKQLEAGKAANDQLRQHRLRRAGSRLAGGASRSSKGSSTKKKTKYNSKKADTIGGLDDDADFDPNAAL